MSAPCSPRPGHDTVVTAALPGSPTFSPCRHARRDGRCAARNLLSCMRDGGAGDDPAPRPVVCDAIRRHIEHDCATGGRIDDVCAREIRLFLAPDGAIASAEGLELLLGLLETVPRVSVDLFALALDQPRLALMEGRGIYFWLRPAQADGVGECDMRFVERVFAAAVRQGRTRLSAAEKQVLRAIDRTADHRQHHAAWNALAELAGLREEARADTRPTVTPWLAVPAAETSRQPEPA